MSALEELEVCLPSPSPAVQFTYTRHRQQQQRHIAMNVSLIPYYGVSTPIIIMIIIPLSHENGQ
jgi:hypothetical protein